MIVRLRTHCPCDQHISRCSLARQATWDEIRARPSNCIFQNIRQKRREYQSHQEPEDRHMDLVWARTEYGGPEEKDQEWNEPGVYNWPHWTEDQYVVSRCTLAKKLTNSYPFCHCEGVLDGFIFEREHAMEGARKQLDLYRTILLASIHSMNQGHTNQSPSCYKTPQCDIVQCIRPLREPTQSAAHAGMGWAGHRWPSGRAIARHLRMELRLKNQAILHVSHNREKDRGILRRNGCKNACRRERRPEVRGWWGSIALLPESVEQSARLGETFRV